MPLDFVKELDDQQNGTIEGLPAIAWINRRYHATAEAALNEAHRASPILGRLYVVEIAVWKGFEQYWPRPTHWRVGTNPPYCEGVIGAFYYPRPNHYIVDSGHETFIPGEAKEEIRLKEKKAWDDFHEKHPEVRKRRRTH